MKEIKFLKRINNTITQSQKDMAKGLPTLQKTREALREFDKACAKIKWPKPPQMKRPCQNK